MIFYLGTHKPHWLSLTSAPLFISRRRLAEYAVPPMARGVWALDSGGFSELSLFGKWETDPGTYMQEVYRWRDAVGNLAWAAIQDWMCEPMITARTGLSVREHQKRTTASYFTLTRFAGDLPWMPVIQGWEQDDYLQHVEDYALAGVDLATLPIVGLGSICRRQGTAMAEGLIREIHAMGIKVHGFGFKLTGLARVGSCLASADSMAWSFAARRSAPLPGHTHKSCANCLGYAIKWRQRVQEILARPQQQSFF